MYRSLGHRIGHMLIVLLTVLFPIWVYVGYMLYLKKTIDFSFPRHCLMPVFPVICNDFDFKNSIIAIKLYLVMIFNLYLTSI